MKKTLMIAIALIMTLTPACNKKTANRIPSRSNTSRPLVSNIVNATITIIYDPNLSTVTIKDEYPASGGGMSPYANLGWGATIHWDVIYTVVPSTGSGTPPNTATVTIGEFKKEFPPPFPGQTPPPPPFADLSPGVPYSFTVTATAGGTHGSQDSNSRAKVSGASGDPSIASYKYSILVELNGITQKFKADPRVVFSDGSIIFK